MKYDNGYSNGPATPLLPEPKPHRRTLSDSTARASQVNALGPRLPSASAGAVHRGQPCGEVQSLAVGARSASDDAAE